MSGPVRNILHSRLLILALTAIIFGNGSDEPQFVFCMGGRIVHTIFPTCFQSKKGAFTGDDGSKRLDRTLEARRDFKFARM